MRGRRKEGSAKTRRRRGAKRVAITEERVITMAPPPGSRFKGYESYVVEDLVVRPATIRYCRQRWRTPAGETIVAPLPPGVRGHVGAELRRYVLVLYHQGRMTVPGLLAHLRDLGVSLSERQLGRLRRRGHTRGRDVRPAGQRLRRRHGRGLRRRRRRLRDLRPERRLQRW